MPIFVLIFSDFFSLCFYFLLFLFLFPSPPILLVPEDHEQVIKTTWPKLGIEIYFHKQCWTRQLALRKYFYVCHPPQQVTPWVCLWVCQKHCSPHPKSVCPLDPIRNVPTLSPLFRTKNVPSQHVGEL